MFRELVINNLTRYGAVIFSFKNSKKGEHNWLFELFLAFLKGKRTSQNGLGYLLPIPLNAKSMSGFFRLDAQRKRQNIRFLSSCTNYLYTVLDKSRFFL